MFYKCFNFCHLNAKRNILDTGGTGSGNGSGGDTGVGSDDKGKLNHDHVLVIYF